MRNTIRPIVCLALTGLLACANQEGGEPQQDAPEVTRQQGDTPEEPAADATADEDLADVAPVEGAPAEGAPTADAPTEETPTEETPAEETPADDAPVAAAGWSDGDTIPSGRDGVPDIQILKVHKNGSGPKCGTGKRATLAYKAMLADGTVLDPGTRPFSFNVGKREAIVGWDIVVAEMRIGDSFTILLPQQLAYGPGRGDLKFDMELLTVE